MVRLFRIRAAQDYTPCGNLVDGTGTFGSPFTFTGELVDANGLLYLRNRYYSAALGVPYRAAVPSGHAVGLEVLLQQRLE